MPLLTHLAVLIGLCGRSITSEIFEVTSVSIKVSKEYQTDDDTLMVTAGFSTSLSFVTSPKGSVASKIIWYIDENQRHISTNSYEFEFIPIDDDGNKQIYCTAFNNHTFTTSRKLKLLVVMNISSVELRENINSSSGVSNVTVTSCAPKTLYCVLGPHKSAATVRWYIDNVQQQTSNTTSAFELIANDNYDSKQIYCSAFSIQQDQEVSSNKHYINVIGLSCSTNYARYIAGIASGILTSFILALVLEKKTRRVSNLFRKKNNEMTFICQQGSEVIPRYDYTQPSLCSAIASEPVNAISDIAAEEGFSQFYENENSQPVNIVYTRHISRARNELDSSTDMDSYENIA